MLKLHVTGNWPADLAEDFRRNFLGAARAAEMMATCAEEADGIVALNSLGAKRCPGNKRVVGFVFEPSWTPNCDRRLAGSCNALYCHNPATFGNASCVRHIGGICWPWVPLETGEGIDRFFAHKPVHKSRTMSIVMSHRPLPADAQDTTLYFQRHQLLRRILSSSLDIDIFNTGPAISDRRAKGYIAQKSDGLLPYKFTVAVENCREPGYVTEKFMDPILCNTIPVYCGAPDIDSIYGAGSNINLKLDDPYVTDQLREIQRLEYETLLPGIQSAKSFYLRERNVFNLMRNELASSAA